MRWWTAAALICAPLSAHAQCAEDIALGADRGTRGMVWVAGGEFSMGSDAHYPEEAPERAARVDGFWIDRHEVTNAQFAQFVATTEYVTLAERDTDAPAGSAVFASGGWQYVEGASWREPEGPGSSVEGRERHPVVHVALEDAEAYAAWLGRALPTETQWEYAAAAQQGPAQANTWQGRFPVRNTAEDGYPGTAPVGCFAPNRHGLHDMIGNVWELTATAAWTVPGRGPANVIKGGSHLCAPNFCRRYRATARQTQEHALGTGHVGFRTVSKAAPPPRDRAHP